MEGFSQREQAFRKRALEMNPLKLLLTVCTPLALYQGLNQVFKILDNLMASGIGVEAVSSVACMNQITTMITALGSGLAVGGSIKVSEAYGQGDDALVKKRVSTVYAMAILVSLLVTVTLVPFAEEFLELLNTPRELIDAGADYFRIEIMALVIQFFNTTYIAMERSRGSVKKIVFLNLAMVCVKLFLTVFFIYGLGGGLLSIAIATLMGQACVLCYAIVSMVRDSGVFCFSLRSVTMKKNVVFPIARLSWPVMLEKILFSSGKVIVNSMSAMYGAMTVGALSISNNIASMTTCWQSGFSDGTAPLISQNRGAGKHGRAVKIYVWLLAINVFIGVVGLLLIELFLPNLADLFGRASENYDSGFRDTIISIHRWEMFGYISLGVHAASAALLMGYGYTKLTMLINGARLFVYRIPVLYILQHYTQMGVEAVGVTMMVSNICTGVMSVLMVIPVLIRIRKFILADSPDSTDNQSAVR